MQNNISVARIAYKKNTEKIKIIDTYKFLGIHKMDLYFCIFFYFQHVRMRRIYMYSVIAPF